MGLEMSSGREKALETLREKADLFVHEGFRDEDGPWRDGPHRIEFYAALAALAAEFRALEELLAEADAQAHRYENTIRALEERCEEAEQEQAALGKTVENTLTALNEALGEVERLRDLLDQLRRSDLLRDTGWYYKITAALASERDEGGAE
jgi:DNA repair exonuclease SbcCD ATPase subunit